MRPSICGSHDLLTLVTVARQPFLRVENAAGTILLFVAEGFSFLDVLFHLVKSSWE